MEQEILNILSEYGVHTVMLALIINLLTALLKVPIKSYSRKSGKNLNRFISLIPVVLGFSLAFVYYGLTEGWHAAEADKVVKLGVGSASLSLALFAIVEKFVAAKADALFHRKQSDASLDAESAMLDRLQPTTSTSDTTGEESPPIEGVRQADQLGTAGEVEVAKDRSGAVSKHQNIHTAQKIILGRRKDGTETEDA